MVIKIDEVYNFVCACTHVYLYTDTCLCKDVLDSCVHTLKHSVHTYMCTNSENISHEICWLEWPGITEEP